MDHQAGLAEAVDSMRRWRTARGAKSIVKRSCCSSSWVPSRDDLGKIGAVGRHLDLVAARVIAGAAGAVEDDPAQPDVPAEIDLIILPRRLCDTRRPPRDEDAVGPVGRRIRDRRGERAGRPLGGKA